MQVLIISLTFTLLALSAIEETSCQVHDLTIVPYSKGKDVVSAVLKKIQRSEVFPESDYDFLRRVAFYETKFGTLNHTYEPADNFGGIWQINETIFNLTQESVNLINLTSRINYTLGIDWANLSWRDLLKPLHSALAARLWLSDLPEKIPQTIQQQAQFWKKYYNTSGNVEQFYQEVRDYENQTDCRGLMDLAMVLDGSGSIFPDDFTLAKGFVLSFIASFSLDNVRSGLIVYSDESEVIFPLEHNETYDGLRDLVLNITQPMALTETNEAILTAVQMLKNVTTVREGVPRILTVFTDGQSTSGISNGPETALNESVTTFAIGIGSDISEEELFVIANNDSSRVYTVQSYDALTELFYKMNTLTCEVPQQPGLNSTVNDTLVKEEKRYYRFEVPLDGLTVTIQVLEGHVAGYYSYTEDTPSSALYDGLIDAASVFIPWINLTSSRQNHPRDGVIISIYIAMEGSTLTNSYSLEAELGDQTPIQEPSTTPVPTTVSITPEPTSTVTTAPTTTSVPTSPTSTVTTAPTTTSVPSSPTSTVTTAPTTTSVPSSPTSTVTTAPTTASITPEPTTMVTEIPTTLSSGSSNVVQAQCIIILVSLMIIRW